MKLSSGYWQTLKEVPADAVIPSHQLMIRGGIIHKSGSGLYNYLPMGVRALHKVQKVIREEMELINAFEVTMTVVTPGELWQRSGRWASYQDGMLKFKDKGQKDLCISPTNEETVTDIFSKTVKSYKNMPVTLYQINTKFRDEIRPRYGLLRGREFLMKDGYSFHATKESLDEVYKDHYQAYHNIFNRLGFEFFAVEADAGSMASSDQKTHEFQAVAENGEDIILYSEETGYAANEEKAETKRPHLEFHYSDKKWEEIETPSCATIHDLCAFLSVKFIETLKARVYKGIIKNKKKVIVCFVLGDDEVNELKIGKIISSEELVLANDRDLAEVGLVNGYIGPIGISSEVVTLFDSAIDSKASYICGALKKDYHIRNFKPDRDLEEFRTFEIRKSKAGDLTKDGKGIVSIKRGIELGHIFQLGDKYTKSMEVTVLDASGKPIYPLMGCYGIGVSRILAAAIEQHQDSKGIVWPKSMAPYQIYFIVISKSPELLDLASKIYQDLKKIGLEVVLDDRKDSAGFKFKDADLLGLPIQLVLGEKEYSNSGTLEIQIRKTGEKVRSSVDDLPQSLQSMLDKCI